MIGIIVFVGFLFCIGFLRMMLREAGDMYGLPSSSNDFSDEERERINNRVAASLAVDPEYQSLMRGLRELRGESETLS